MDAEGPVSAFAVYKQQKPKSSATNQRKTRSFAKKDKLKPKIDSADDLTNRESQVGNVKLQVVNKSTSKKGSSSNSPKDLSSENIKSQENKVKSLKTKLPLSQTDPVQRSKKMKLDHSEINQIEYVNGVETIDLDLPNSEEDFVRKLPKNKLNKKSKENCNKNVQITSTEEEKRESSHTIVISGPDSVENGKQLFSWVIYPIEVDKFFKENWEKQSIYVKRNVASYFENLISCEEIDNVLRRRKLFFTKNIDITSYSPEKGKRETHNPPGRANAPLVWDYYSNGCSIRLLNPQKYFTKIHAMNALLQEFFGCLVGANVYLTPAGTQGFAPHYDDIEAFVLQVEGQKLWKLYPPRTPAETLPRFSSGNFNEEDLGPPLQEILLSPGDMLYFPRGIIHQGKALEHTHSLHITLSMYQKNSWADLLEHLIPAALKIAIEEDVAFREGLPMGYLAHMGVVHSDIPTKHRAHFINKLQDLIGKLVQHAPVDAACDQMGKQFVHDSLPPHLRQAETDRMVYGDGEKVLSGKVYNQAELGLDTRVKLVRYNCLRVVTEDDAIRIYYSVNNSREYHAEDPQFLEVEEDLAPAIDALIFNYPDYLAVEDFPIEGDIAKVQVASDLWEHGLLVTEKPLGYDSD